MALQETDYKVTTYICKSMDTEKYTYDCIRKQKNTKLLSIAAYSLQGSVVIGVQSFQREAIASNFNLNTFVPVSFTTS